MNTVQVVVLVAVTLALSVEGRTVTLDDSHPEEVLQGVYGVREYPIVISADGSESLEPTIAEEGSDEEVVLTPLHPLFKRSTTVFRPLFATRERDAKRAEMRERRQEYWANEERRRSAYHGQPLNYPAQYRPYPAGYPTGYPTGR